MTALPTSPALLMTGVLALIAGGLIVMTWGRRLPRQGSWIIGLGLLVLLVVVGIDWSILSEEGFAPQPWLRGWIWPREEVGAITVGVLRDALGLSMASLTALVAGSLIFGIGAQIREQRADRFCASLAFSAAGVALSWFALTPWLALTGLAITIFGGFLALGAQWSQPNEAALATRFAWERTWGMILALLGLCVLAGGRASLSLIGAAGQGSWLAQAGGGGSTSDLIGAGLLFVGALVQLQPFPLLGWVMKESVVPCQARIVLAQVFPAWAVFALLIRLEPQFRELGVFPAFGWLGLASAFLTAVAGLFRNQWRLGLSAWTAAGFSMAVAALAFAGPSSALCIALGVGLGASAISGFAGALEEGGPETSENRRHGIWAKVGCALGAAAGTGFIGFTAAGGGVRWLTFLSGNPALAAATVFVIFLYAFLGWKVAWMGIALKNASQTTWAAVLAPYLLVLLSLGLVWTGTATGGVLPGNPDHLFHSLLTLIFGASSESWGDESSFGTASALYWGSLVVAMAGAYWTAGKRPETWPSLSRSIPRFSAFIQSGYGIDPLFGRIVELIAALGRWSVWLVDQKIWQQWMPNALATGLQRSAQVIASADSKISWRLGGILHRPVDAGSKVLQLIQNGDVQWYLFFAVGSGIAILAHFMRT